MFAQFRFESHSQINCKISKKYPDVFVNIGTDHTQALEQKLLRREIDIAVTFQPHTQHGIIATPILDIPLVYIDSQPIDAKQDIHSIDENRWIQPYSDSLMQVVKSTEHLIKV